MIKLLLYLWQLPQNILGLLFIVNHQKDEIKTKKGTFKIFKTKLFYSGISLGDYIIFDGRIEISETDVLHEYGHQLQSRILGPFYLLIVGIPSLIGNIYSRIKTKDEKWYYSRFPENWADKLGGVNSRIL